MIKIFDRYLNITNREGFTDCTEELLERLSGMLNEYGVAHSYCLTDAKEIEEIESRDRDYCVTIMYEEKDEVTFSLVYMLWAKIHRGVSDELIKKAMGKKSVKDTTEELGA